MEHYHFLRTSELFGTSYIFGHLPKSLEIFRYSRVIFENPGTPRKNSYAFESDKVGWYTILFLF